MTRTDGISFVKQYAAVRPAGPPPTTNTSASTFKRGKVLSSAKAHLCQCYGYIPLAHACFAVAFPKAALFWSGGFALYLQFMPWVASTTRISVTVLRVDFVTR